MDQYEVVSMREYRTIPPQDLMLGERIGEGQFGDVHSGLLYPKVGVYRLYITTPHLATPLYVHAYII